MSYTPHGRHLLNGSWMSGDDTFLSRTLSGDEHAISLGRISDINAACAAAEEAFWSYSRLSIQARADFLNKIADEIEARGEDVTSIGMQETGLPEMRLNGERGRTTGQLRLMAEHILSGIHLDYRHDTTMPDREPLPRPDIKLVQRPIGPVAVFGASNFPLAFSTAGGDTASALAAGCPVVVKGHPAHPGTSEIIADAILAAIKACDIHPGVFSLIQDGGPETGAALVQHPAIQAVGFTGSLKAGRILFDLCAKRPDPIPFFGELGSVNPMFLLEHALRDRGDNIADGWAASLTMGAGQFCTNPGIVIAVEGESADKFISQATTALSHIAAQTMLTDNIAKAFSDGQKRIAASTGVRELLATSCQTREAGPYLYQASGTEWLKNDTLAEEVFGPLGIIILAQDIDEMTKIAHSLHGQLTCTIHMDDDDMPVAQTLMPILERKAGRILVNGYPTGVEVCDAMVHSGPYPASTNFGATSVGTLSVRRFLRPVCYQNMPDALLPDLKA